MTVPQRATRARPRETALAKAERDWKFLQERIARMLAADASRDPDGSYHRRCRALADEAGADVGDVVDEWEERAAVREYLGETDRATANRLAFDDVEARLTLQRVLL